MIKKLKIVLITIIAIIPVLLLSSCKVEENYSNAHSNLNYQEISDIENTSITNSEATESSSEVTGVDEISEDFQAVSFTGEWKKTNISQAYQGTILITNQMKNSFGFSFEGYRGANSGGIDGTATIISSNKAVFENYSEYYERTSKATFVIEDGLLIVSVDDDDESGFDMLHASIRGTYTLGDPIYSNADIENKIFSTEQIKKKVKTLIGNDIYAQLTDVFTYGVEYIDDNFTYIGFINGAGMGADILIKEEKVYLLLYGLGFDSYRFYTNDPSYKDKMPSAFVIRRDKYSLKYFYKKV